MAEKKVTVSGTGDDGKKHDYDVTINVDDKTGGTTITVKRDDEKEETETELTDVKKSKDGQTVKGNTPTPSELLGLVEARITIEIICPKDKSKPGTVKLKVETRTKNIFTGDWSDWTENKAKSNSRSIKHDQQDELVKWVAKLDIIPNLAAVFRSQHELIAAREAAVSNVTVAIVEALRTEKVSESLAKYLLTFEKVPGLEEAHQVLSTILSDASRVPFNSELSSNVPPISTAICCFLYDLLHRAKHIIPFGKNGETFKTTKKNIRAQGRVVKVEGYMADCDYCFDIETEDGEILHCEITICDRDRLQRFINELEQYRDDINSGDLAVRVTVAGDRAIDPPHDDPADGEEAEGGPEIHPVKGAWVESVGPI